MNRLVIVVFLLLSIFYQRLDAQVDSSDIKMFSGIIIDDALEYAIPSVHLWNENMRMGSISSDSGEFSLKVRSQDTVVLSAIGYFSSKIVVSSSVNQKEVVRLKPKTYEIGEVVVRRFGSYESFKYQVIHLDLPETKTAQLKKYIKSICTVAALEADGERAVKNRMNGFGFSTPLSGNINREKAFREKITNLKRREQVINAKFNRALVGDITQFEGDKLTKFIALCNFSEAFLYEANLYTITEALYAKLNTYNKNTDSIPSASGY